MFLGTLCFVCSLILFHFYCRATLKKTRRASVSSVIYRPKSSTAMPRYVYSFVFIKMCNTFSSLLSLQGFLNHVRYDHNLWDYAYYSLYVDSIDVSNHNAIQKYVHDMVGTFFSLKSGLNNTFLHIFSDSNTIVIVFPD